MQDGRSVFRYGEPLPEHAEDEGMVQADMNADQDQGDGRAGLVHDFPDGPCAVDVENDAGDGDAADANKYEGDQGAERNGIAESGSGGDGAAGEPGRDGADPPAVR